MDIIKDIEYDQYYTHDIVESKYIQCSLNKKEKEKENINISVNK